MYIYCVCDVRPSYRSTDWPLLGNLHLIVLVNMRTEIKWFGLELETVCCLVYIIDSSKYALPI